MKTYPLPSEHSNAHKRTKRFATTSASSLWPGAIVPYYFDSGYGRLFCAPPPNNRVVEPFKVVKVKTKALRRK